MYLGKSNCKPLYIRYGTDYGTRRGHVENIQKILRAHVNLIACIYVRRYYLYFIFCMSFPGPVELIRSTLRVIKRLNKNRAVAGKPREAE